MAVCHQCGASTGDEKFCGVCGTRLQRDTAAVPFGDSLTPPPPSASSQSSSRSSEAMSPDRHTSMSAQRGRGELVEENELCGTGTSETSSPRRSKPKTLEAGKVLNHRYEVVRRIGVGGM